jgi:hypothetical protein
MNRLDKVDRNEIPLPAVKLGNNYYVFGYRIGNGGKDGHLLVHIEGDKRTAYYLIKSDVLRV